MEIQPNNWQSVKLYDGAFEIELPSTFRNIADLVPVPDSQFVFQDMASEGTDINFGQLIIELVDVSEISDS